MNILIPAWSFYPAQEGGPSNALYWLASGLAKVGHNVTVVTTNRCICSESIEFNKWYRLNDFNVIYCSIDTYKSTLISKLDENDLILASGVCQLSQFLFNLRALSNNKLLVISPRGELFDSAIYHKGVFYGWLKMLMFFIMRLAYGRKVLYHVTSKEESVALMKVMGKKSRFVNLPNYMILPDVIPNESEKEQQEYLLYVGRINRIKNIHVLLHALSKSKSFKTQKYKLYIVGQPVGQYYNELLQLIAELDLSDYVEFKGHIEGAEKNILYARAKCTLLISQSENFGNVVVESLTQGTPVIASEGTPWQSLGEKSAGFWIKADPDVVAHTVDNILNLTDDSYMQMRENAYMLAKEFDVYENIGKWDYVLSNLK